MNRSRFLKTVMAVAIIILAISSVVTYLYCKITREKAYNEKWGDYVDCGLA